MGQGFSTGNNLHLQLDKPCYYGGEQVTGKLYVNIATTVAIKSLQVKVYSPNDEFSDARDTRNRQPLHGIAMPAG
jgi:hypothetical protein